MPGRLGLKVTFETDPIVCWLLRQLEMKIEGPLLSIAQSDLWQLSPSEIHCSSVADEQME